MILLAILFPCLLFFLRGKILTGIICLILQITVIGWLPAAIWAVMSHVSAKNEENLRQMERRIMNSQQR